MAAVAPQKLTTFLAFESRLEEAVNFYLSLFEDSEMVKEIRSREGEPGWEPDIFQVAHFTLAGQQFMAITMPPPGARGHDHAPWQEYAFFSPAMAIYVQCDTHAEFDKLYAALSEQGGIITPVGSYGFSAKFAWLNDRFGVSWRLNLSQGKDE